MAQSDQQQQHGRAQGQPQGGGKATAPRGGAQAVAPRATRTTITPRANRTTVTRPENRTTVTQRATRMTVTQRANRTMITPRETRKKVTPRATRTKVAPEVVTPKGKGAVKIVSPSGSNARIATAGKFHDMPAHGAGQTIIRGKNFSVWRSGYRIRHGNRWRTFVALSALSAIIIGSSDYYPYAYISAPQPYCEGWTEDGCQLMWQEVQTVERDVVDQCVAYCPWQ